MPIKKKFFSKKIIGGKTLKLQDMNNAAVGLTQAVGSFLSLLIIVKVLGLLGSGPEPVLASLTAITAPLFAFSFLLISILWLILVTFAYPILMLSEGKARRALEILFYDFFWLIVIMVLFLALALLK